MEKGEVLDRHRPIEGKPLQGGIDDVAGHVSQEVPADVLVGLQHGGRCVLLREERTEDRRVARLIAQVLGQLASEQAALRKVRDEDAVGMEFLIGFSGEVEAPEVPSRGAVTEDVLEPPHLHAERQRLGIDNRSGRSIHRDPPFTCSAWRRSAQAVRT